MFQTKCTWKMMHCVITLANTSITRPCGQLQFPRESLMCDVGVCDCGRSEIMRSWNQFPQPIHIQLMTHHGSYLFMRDCDPYVSVSDIGLRAWGWIPLFCRSFANAESRALVSIPFLRQVGSLVPIPCINVCWLISSISRQVRSCFWRVDTDEYALLLFCF